MLNNITSENVTRQVISVPATFDTFLKTYSRPAAAATGEVKSSRVMFARSEKVGKVQSFVGHSSREE